MLSLHDDYHNLEYLKFFVDRYQQCDLSSIQTYLAVVRLADRLQSKSEAYFQRMDLSKGRFLIMKMLARSGESGLAPAEIAQNISCARATVTGLLDTLEAAGYIERLADPQGDRRSLRIRLTPAGQSKLDAVLPRHHQRIKQAMSDFSMEERDQLMSLLAKFNKGLSAFENNSNESSDHAQDISRVRKEKP
ncbi:MAG TPA: MarR family transcriptional regulator [Oligoflexus sp.]|uniref:MarR family winged helix-turn-helix transcriptional regulator n=1 Tax=Oligoflexus sp. TaxID=1971216 RepID=UPI002D7E741F|nr:MarR family transcriptional regulator [Oligoflexus sp.]HET9239349.1 MarR family transcriptional regulator [Oligoflexus sp.]